MGNTQKNNRVRSIDIAKGIGIILVVFGHLVTARTNISFIIYSFHMPLFFTLAGIFANSKISFLEMLKKETKRLMLPYFAVLLVGTLFSIAFFDGFQFNFKELLYSAFTGNGAVIHNRAIWFLPCLFFVKVYFFFADRFVFQKCSTPTSFLLLGVIAIAGFYLPAYLQNKAVMVPLKADMAIMALVFFQWDISLKSKLFVLKKWGGLKSSQFF